MALFYNVLTYKVSRDTAQPVIFAYIAHQRLYVAPPPLTQPYRAPPALPLRAGALSRAVSPDRGGDRRGLAGFSRVLFVCHTP